MTDKKIKSVSLSPHVYEHIEQNGEIRNFSSWVEEVYKENFMKMEILEEKKEIIQKELKEWKIAQDKFKMNELKKESVIQHIFNKLSDKSKFYLIRIPDLLLKGFDIKTIHKSFCNNDLGYNISMKEFEDLIEYNKKHSGLSSPVTPLDDSFE